VNDFVTDADWLPFHPARAGRASPCHRVRSTRTATCSAPEASSRSRPSASTRRATRARRTVQAARVPRLRPQRHRPGHLPRRRQQRHGRRAACFRRRARGVAMVRPDVTDEELALLHEAGVRGVRFNFVKRLVDPKPDEYYRASSSGSPGSAGMSCSISRHPISWSAGSCSPRCRPPSWSTTWAARRHRAGGRSRVRAVPDLHARPSAGLHQGHLPERLSVRGPPDYDDVVPFASARGVLPGPGAVGHRLAAPQPQDHMPDDGNLVDFVPRIASPGVCGSGCWSTIRLRLYWGPTMSDPEFDDIPGTTVFTAGRAERASPQPVLHEPDEGGEPGAVQGGRERLPRRMAADPAQRGPCSTGTTTPRSPRAATSTSCPRSSRPTARAFPPRSHDGRHDPEDYAAMMLAGGRSPEGSARSGKGATWPESPPASPPATCPAIGAALDLGKSGDDYWRPVFAGYDWTKKWIAEEKPGRRRPGLQRPRLGVLDGDDPDLRHRLRGELRPADEGFGPRPVPVVEGHPELAWHIAQSLILDEFD
jgi:hypothetical protein